MTVPVIEEAKAARSYLGVAACVMFVIASAIVGQLTYQSATAPYKMAGFEGIILIPLALAIYGLGMLFGYRGWKSAEHNPGSRLGLILNFLPVGLFFGSCIYGMAFGNH